MQPDILQNYVPSDVDDGGSTKYYGFVQNDGDFYILRQTSTTFRYFRGNGDYVAAWTDRASKTYDYFFNIFNDIS